MKYLNLVSASIIAFLLTSGLFAERQQATIKAPQRAPLNTSQFPKINPAKALRVVSELQGKLTKDAVVVIFGAPGSGKTEQMELALQQKPYTVFDLRNRFLAAHFTKNNITDAAAQADIKRKYESLKNDEKEWILGEKDRIIDELAMSKDDTIVLDEFDMAKAFGTGSPAAKSAETVLLIGKKIREKNPNKKIIFIIHEEGLGSKEVASAMKEYFNISPLETLVIRTGYFKPAEEKLLLTYTNWKNIEKQKFMNLMQGHPSAYLPLIKKMAGLEKKEFTYNELVENAKTTIKKVYAVMEKIQPGLISVFKEMAKGNYNNAQANKDALINSGFVDTTLFMTEIVKQILLDQAQALRTKESGVQLAKYLKLPTDVLVEVFSSPQWAQL